MARPRKKVDEKLLEKLAYIHLPEKYIANCLGISEDTLHRRFADKIDECKAKGKAKLKQLAWNKAESGDWSAIKFLLQNYLNMHEKVDQNITSNKEFVLAYNPATLKKQDEPKS